MVLKIIEITTPTLGDRSYLIHDGTTALVIDPQRDIDRVQEILRAQGVVLGAVAETHIHNDYVTGGLQLSRIAGTPYIICKYDHVLFEHVPVEDHDIVEVGSFAIRARHSPGHTFNHISYELLDQSGAVVGLFTGGSILHGSTGRPDLLGMEHANELATLQYKSAHIVAHDLQDSNAIYPTHGFGSFCSATPATGTSSTIADEKVSNPVFLLDQITYVLDTLSKLDAYPTYFEYMAEINSSGPQALTEPLFSLLDTSSKHFITSTEVETALANGKMVIDVRNRESWCARHIPGTISLGLDGSMASYAGWVIPFADPMIIISDDPALLQQAHRELIRIGKDKIQMALINFYDVSTCAATRIVHYSNLSELDGKNVTILDVRQNLEHQASHIEGSLHIPLHELEARMEEVPQDQEIWVHCASGYRAAAALGLLERGQRNATLINGLFKSSEAKSLESVLRSHA